MFEKRIETHHEIQDTIFKSLPKEGIIKKEFMEFLDRDPKEKDGGIYVHTPFCDKLCSFCNMNRKFCDSNMEEYTNFLINEFEKFGKKNFVQKKIFSVVFWGGGTPTIYSKEQLIRILKSFRENFSLNNDYEWTFETTLHNLDMEKLKVMENYGINRLSIGVQTFSNKGRKILNRTFNEKEVIKKIQEIQNNFKGKVCIDIIFDYPYETEEEIINDAKRCVDLKVDSVSFCTLIFYERSKIARDIEEGKIEFEKNFDRNRKYHNLFLEALTNNGYKIIENGKVSINDKYEYINLINADKDLLPLGIGAGGNLEGIGIYRLSKETEFYAKCGEFERKLKLLYGLFQYPTVELKKIKRIFPDKYDKIYKKLLYFSEKGYLEISEKDIKLTLNGIYLGHTIDAEILKICLENKK